MAVIESLTLVWHGSIVPSNLALYLICAFFIFAWAATVEIFTTSKIPGPWYLKLTTIFQKYHEFNGTRTPWVHSLHVKYGAVVQTAYNEVSFASPSAAKQIYSTEYRLFNKTELYNLFRQEGHINLFTALDHHTHAQIRRPLGDQYSNSNVLKSKVMETITERAATFAKHCASTSSADVYFYLHAYALDCVTAMLFHPYNTRSLDTTTDKEMVRLLSYQNVRIPLLFAHYFPFLATLWQIAASGKFRLEKHERDIRAYVNDTIRKADHSPFALAPKLLSSDTFDMTLAEAECMDHIGAGIETTGDTLCLLMWELSQPENEAKVNRLHRELQTVTTENRLEGLVYLNAVIQEALRLWAPGTAMLPRYVPKEGRVIDNYFIPAGMIVGCPSYTMHRLDTSIFPDPDTFEPERWLAAEKNAERQRSTFAFGLGTRTCIGKHLAQAEMRACIHAVYSKYITRPAKDMNVTMELEDQVLTSRPKNMCCKLEFIPR